MLVKPSGMGMTAPAFFEFHEAGIGGMAVKLQVMQIELVALDIHLARIPVAIFRHALRRPMRPDAEFGVAEPVGRVILRLQRLPIRLERSRSDGLAQGRCRAEGGQRRSLLQEIAFAQHHRVPWMDRFLLKKGMTKSWKRNATLLVCVPG